MTSKWSTRQIELLSEPKLRRSAAGKAVLGISAGLVGDSKVVFDAVAFGSTAETIAERYRKGSSFIARGYFKEGGSWVIHELLSRGKEESQQTTPTEAIPQDPYQGWQTNPIIFCQKFLGDEYVYKAVAEVVPMPSALFTKSESKPIAKGKDDKGFYRVGGNLNRGVLAKFREVQKRLLQEAYPIYLARKHGAEAAQQAVIDMQAESYDDPHYPPEEQGSIWEDDLDTI